MFLKAIGVKGYQSLYEVALPLGNFTVIYGESDVGKSALYRAFRALVVAETGDSFISTGTNRAGVSVLLNSGDKVSWIKRKGKSPIYRLNDRNWQRNKTPPQEIIKKLRVFPVMVDKEPIYPNLRGQFDSLFMLFETPGKRARVLGALISNILLYGIRQANLERNRNEADIRAAQNLVDDLQKAEEFPWNDYVAKINATKRRVERGSRATALYSKLVSLRERLLQLHKISKFKAELFSETELKRIGKIVMLHEKLRGLQSHLVVAYRSLEKYNRQLEYEQGEVAKMQMEVENLKKQMTFPCPHCGKQIRYLEVVK